MPASLYRVIPVFAPRQAGYLPLFLSARFGLGFVHFLYDRWLYKFSDPEVGATIGQDIFGTPASGAARPLARAA